MSSSLGVVANSHNIRAFGRRTRPTATVSETTPIVTRRPVGNFTQRQWGCRYTTVGCSGNVAAVYSIGLEFVFRYVNQSPGISGAPRTAEFAEKYEQKNMPIAVHEDDQHDLTEEV